MLFLYNSISFSLCVTLLLYTLHVLLQTQPHIVIMIILPFEIISSAQCNLAPSHLLGAVIGKFVIHILHFYLVPTLHYIHPILYIAFNVNLKVSNCLLLLSSPFHYCYLAHSIYFWNTPEDSLIPWLIDF